MDKISEHWQYARSQQIGQYRVAARVKCTPGAQCYRVTGADGLPLLLKLIDTSRLGRWQIEEDGGLAEIAAAKAAVGPNLCRCQDTGVVVADSRRWEYYVTEYVSGETLAEAISRGEVLEVYRIKQVARGVLRALHALHTLKRPLVHNAVCLQNVMLPASGGLEEGVRLIGLGHARFLDQRCLRMPLQGVCPLAMAPELLGGVSSVQTDIFAVGVLVYQLIYGHFPWFSSLSGSDEHQVSQLEKARMQRLSLPEKEMYELDDILKATIRKALSLDPADRFATADKFIDALDGKTALAELTELEISPSQGRRLKKPKKGKGFSAVAGMAELKERMQREVINAMRSPEAYAAYGLSVPNGLLLYGPPGCGKTFFAKKLAEEAGCAFMHIYPSSLTSKWVNETQQKIAEMFAEAEKQAPVIIFIDEINSLAPSRRSNDVHGEDRKAVNELLAQMDHTGEKGIFIIGATNFPDTIDEALLRAGRLEKHYYLPPPDLEARTGLFELMLSTRPCDFGIDCGKLAEMTESYVAADIEMIVNEAARHDMEENSKIRQSSLMAAVKSILPSVKKNDLELYERIHDKMEGNGVPTRPTVGFK